MARNTGIDWTDHTWNTWQGCRKVSLGCVNCYMYRDKKRFGQDPATVIRSSAATFNAPLKWKDQAKVFVCSWSDFFIEDADDWRDDAWEIMRQTPNLTYQLLTKRPENIESRLPHDWPLENVWLGVTAENQNQMEQRLPELMRLDAVVRFVSVEPMLSPVFLHVVPCRQCNHPGDILEWPCSRCGGKRFDLPDWVICGGETGPGARAMAPEFAVDLKKQCAEFGIPFFMKQMTNREPIPSFLMRREFPRGL